MENFDRQATVQVASPLPNLFKNFDKNHPDIEVLAPHDVIIDSETIDFKLTRDKPQYTVQNMQESPDLAKLYGDQADAAARSY